MRSQAVLVGNLAVKMSAKMTKCIRSPHRGILIAIASRADWGEPSNELFSACLIGLD